MCRAAASRRPRTTVPTCGFDTSTGTISRSKRPSSIAAIARRCDSSEYASSSSRESPHSSAITSAEIPCGTICQRSQSFVRAAVAAEVRAHRDAGHVLDAGRDDEVELARLDRRRRVEGRLHRRPALPVDGRAAHTVSGQPATSTAPRGRRSAPARRPASRSPSGRLRSRPGRRRGARRGRSGPAPRARRRGSRDSVPFRLPIGERTASTIVAPQASTTE